MFVLKQFSKGTCCYYYCSNIFCHKVVSREAVNNASSSVFWVFDGWWWERWCDWCADGCCWYFHGNRVSDSRPTGWERSCVCVEIKRRIHCRGPAKGVGRCFRAGLPAKEHGFCHGGRSLGEGCVLLFVSFGFSSCQRLVSILTEPLRPPFCACVSMFTTSCSFIWLSLCFMQFADIYLFMNAVWCVFLEIW